MDAAPPSYYLNPPSHFPYFDRPPAIEHLPPPYPHSQHPLPPPSAHDTLSAPLPHHDEVRTLFIAGLPDDCKSREIYNLFREFPGYHSSHLRCSTESSHAYAFAVFDDQQSAVSAMHALNGFLFDLENDSTLHIELARSNPKSTKLLRKGVGSNMRMPGMGNSAYNTHDYLYPQGQSSFDYDDAREAKQNIPTYSRTSSQKNPPCPTIFVANLSPSCSQRELTEIFSKYPGFLKLKMQRKNGVPVAFVDFQDIATSSQVLNSLQGTTLYSPFGAGRHIGERILIEFSKSRMKQHKHDR